MEESRMKMMDCVELIVEKSKYAKEGVHKGMDGFVTREKLMVFGLCPLKEKFFKEKMAFGILPT